MGHTVLVNCSKDMKKDKAKFLENFRQGRGIVSYACEKTGISRATYYNWINGDEDFKKACEDINESVIDVVESKLLSQINDDNLTAIIFFLKTKGKKRGYVEKVESDVSINAFEKLMHELPDDIE